MAHVFIFHGIGGNPQENWFPWLTEKLEAEGHHVTVPAFPHPEEPSLSEWFEHFQKYEVNVNAETIFVGHSLGAAFALRLLERTKHAGAEPARLTLSQPDAECPSTRSARSGHPSPTRTQASALRRRVKDHIKATFLVAPVSSVMDNEFDPLMTTFTEAPYDWSAIRRNCRHIEVIHAPDDPYIALAKAEALAKNLGVNVTTIENAGHFNAASGYTTFPQLLTAVLQGA